MKSRKDQYTVLFDEKKLNLLLNKEKYFLLIIIYME